MKKQNEVKKAYKTRRLTWALGTGGEKTPCPEMREGDTIVVVAHEGEPLAALRKRLRYAQDMRDARNGSGFELDAKKARRAVLNAYCPDPKPISDDERIRAGLDRIIR